jgi:hypothetical protein
MLIGVVKRTTNVVGGGQERHGGVSLHAAVAVDAHGVGDTALAAKRYEFEGVVGLDWGFAEWFKLGKDWAEDPWGAGQVNVGIEIEKRNNEKAGDEKDADPSQKVWADVHSGRIA